MHMTLTLNTKQITELVSAKSVKLDEHRYVELLNDDILINISGKGYYPNTIDIKYEEYRDERALPIERIQKLICEHFNIEADEVIFSKSCGIEFEFIIRFGANNLREMVVRDFQTAMNNINEFLDYEKYPKTEQFPPYIGFYRQLNDSPYYFSWI